MFHLTSFFYFTTNPRNLLKTNAFEMLLRCSRSLVTILLSLLLSLDAIAGTIPGDSLLTDEELAHEVLSITRQAQSLSATKRDSAELLLKRAFALSRARKYDKGIALAYFSQSNVSRKHNEFAFSIIQGDSAEAIFLRVGDTANAGRAANSIGIALRQIGDLLGSVEAYDRATEFGKVARDTLGISNALNNTALVYLQIENYSLAKDYLSQSYEYARKTNQTELEANALTNLGNVFVYLEDYDSALVYFHAALQIADSFEIKHIQRKCRINTGNVYFGLEQYEEAIGWVRSALQPEDQVEDHGDQSLCLHILHDIYLAMDDYERARDYMDLSCAISEEHQILQGMLNCRESNAAFWEKVGDFEKALYFTKEFNRFEDSIFSEETQVKLMQMESQRQMRQKNKEMETLEANQRREARRLREVIAIVAAGAILLLLLAIFLLLILRYRSRSRLAKVEQKIAEGKLAALRSQMNPHFIFNAFNAIQNFILKSEKIEAYNYLNKFASLLRSIVGNASDIFIPLDREISLLTTYLELEKLRFREKLSYQIEIAPELLGDNPMIPSMMIQPHVENALVHGLSNLQGQGELLLRMKPWKEGLICEIVDNGIGREAAQGLKEGIGGKHLSIASVNGQERLQFLRETGYSMAHIQIIDLHSPNGARGTKVRIYLPFIFQDHH